MKMGDSPRGACGKERIGSGCERGRMGHGGVVLRDGRGMGIAGERLDDLGPCYNLQHIRRRGHRNGPCRRWVMSLRKGWGMTRCESRLAVG